MIKGTVAIIGRPNVGKSTLFNRLTKSDAAIVDDMPGVTRDRLYGIVKKVDPSEAWQSYVLVDTGGFETDDFNFQPFGQNIVWHQTEQAIQAADLVVLVFDGKEGRNPHDVELINYVRKLEKPVVFVVNKIDGVELESRCWDFYEVGANALIWTSAAHNRNIWELSKRIEDELGTISRLTKKAVYDGSTKIAIIGRPNVGKSSILNRLVNEERSLVSDVAGTTRDTVDVAITYNQKHYIIVDTAGIRRRPKIFDKLESISVIRSLRMIDEADIIVLVTDGTELNDQDARLASLTVDRHKPLLIVVNKWDLVNDKTTNTMKETREEIHHKLRDTDYLPVIFTSCLENKRVRSILSEVESLATSYHKRVKTADVNASLEQAINKHTPALIRKFNKRVKFYYATQVRTAPPTIVIKCNVADEIQESYKRYLKRHFRETLDFGAVPIRLLYRGKTKKDDAPPHQPS